MKNVYHFTSKHFQNDILRDGQILTEREKLNKNLELCRDTSIPKEWRRHTLERAVLLKTSYKLLGSYVWFTQNPEGVATATGNDCVFEFDADDIGAVRWVEVMKTLTSKKQKRHLKSLMDIAIEEGDDPRDWWVTRKSVSVEKCICLHTNERLVA